MSVGLFSLVAGADCCEAACGACGWLLYGAGAPYWFGAGAYGPDW